MEKSNTITDSKIHAVKEELLLNENISFALLFGSAVSKTMHSFSDVDIGLYFHHEPTLHEIGRIIAHLEKFTHHTIDVVELNDIYKKNPQLAFEIISKNEILFIRDNNTFSHFKERAILSYLDTIALRKIVSDSFSKRIKTHTFGRFNHA